MAELFGEVGQRRKLLIANICSEELAGFNLALKSKQKATQPLSNPSSLQNNRLRFTTAQICTGCARAAGLHHGNEGKSTEQIVTAAEYLPPKPP